MEVRYVGSHATADDVVEGRAQLPQVLGNHMADTLARMSADPRGHLVNLAAYQVEPAERAPS